MPPGVAACRPKRAKWPQICDSTSSASRAGRPGPRTIPFIPPVLRYQKASPASLVATAPLSRQGHHDKIDRISESVDINVVQPPPSAAFVDGPPPAISARDPLTSRHLCIARRSLYINV